MTDEIPLKYVNIMFFITLQEQLAMCKPKEGCAEVYLSFFYNSSAQQAYKTRIKHMFEVHFTLKVGEVSEKGSYQTIISKRLFSVADLGLLQHPRCNALYFCHTWFNMILHERSPNN